MKELILLANALRQADNNSELALQLYSRPQMRHQFIKDLLRTEVVRTMDENRPIAELTIHYDAAMNKLMDQFWDKTWGLHACHFHKSFEEYVNCPFTCLTEIADTIEAIAKGA